MSFQTIRGTKDILPNEAHRWHLIERGVRSWFDRSGYREIRTPAFEETALFARGIGALTDIVSKEMYTFTDRGGTSITLKPEMTAAVLRAHIQHSLGAQSPLSKYFYISPMFRQERPQAGRLRQFHQFGAEAIGSPNPEIDAEMILLAISIYRQFNLRQLSLKLNSVGCEKCRPPYKNSLRDYLRPLSAELSEDSKRRLEENPMRVLDSKVPRDQELTAGAPALLDFLCDECSTHLKELRSMLDAASVEYVMDSKLVRGLDYYTKTAFEIISSDLGSQDALAGGGRYDLLAAELGGISTPGIGFAAGIERLLMVLEKLEYPFEPPPHPDVFVVLIEPGMRADAFSLVRTLRQEGIAADMDFHRRSIKAQMKEASRLHSRIAVFVGGDEWVRGEVTIKDLSTGEQYTLARTYMQTTINSILR